MARSIRTSPIRNWFSSNSPTDRTRRFPRWSMSSTFDGFRRSVSRYRMTSWKSCGCRTLLVERGLQAELRVQLQPPHPRKVVLLRVEEHALEQRPRAVEGGRIAGPQPPVDLDQRLLVRLDRVLPQRGRQHRADLVPLREEDLDGAHFLLLSHRHDARRDLVVRFEDDLAGLRIDDVGHREGPVQLVGNLQLDGRDAGPVQRLDAGPCQLACRPGPAPREPLAPRRPPRRAGRPGCRSLPRRASTRR